MIKNNQGHYLYKPATVIACNNTSGAIENILLINCKNDYPILLDTSKIKAFSKTNSTTKNLLILN